MGAITWRVGRSRGAAAAKEQQEQQQQLKRNIIATTTFAMEIILNVNYCNFCKWVKAGSDQIKK